MSRLLRFRDLRIRAIRVDVPRRFVRRFVLVLLVGYGRAFDSRRPHALILDPTHDAPFVGSDSARLVALSIPLSAPPDRRRCYRASARAVSSALVLAPTFRSRFETWNLTVFALMPSRRAIA